MAAARAAGPAAAGMALASRRRGSIARRFRPRRCDTVLLVHRSGGERRDPADLLPAGLYELLVTRRVAAAARALGDRARTGGLVAAEAPAGLGGAGAVGLLGALRGPPPAEERKGMWWGKRVRSE